MSTYFAILTEVGEAKLANAIALGQTLKLKNLAVGDGNGNLPMPSRTQKALVREVRRAGLNQLTIDPANTSQIIVEQVLPEDVGGWWIREIGIFDEAGDLCAVANCPPSYKPLMLEGSGRTQVVRIVLIVASTAAIELKIDPSIILATRKYVDDQDIVVRAYSDAQLAKHLASLDPHPLLAKVAYVDQQDTSARAYGDQQLAKHQAAADPHPLLAKVAYVDQQDANVRTYVDQQVGGARAYGDQQLAKHQGAADPHPLLAKVAYVDQQDASARTYVDQQVSGARTYGAQQLADHLAAANPHPQYSMKTVPTLPKFDASLQLANAAFVQQAQGNLVGYVGVGDSRTLTAYDMGSALYFERKGSTITIPTPASLGLPGNSGKCVKFFGLFNAGTLIAAPGVNIGFDVGSIPSISIKQGQFLTLMATGNNVWQVIDSTAEMARNVDFNARFGSAKGVGDYQFLPSGYISQWGTTTSAASGQAIVALPFAFPMSLLSIALVPLSTVAMYCTANADTRSGFTINIWTAAGTPAPGGISVNWRVIGY